MMVEVVIRVLTFLCVVMMVVLLMAVGGKVTRSKLIDRVVGNSKLMGGNSGPYQ